MRLPPKSQQDMQDMLLDRGYHQVQVQGDQDQIVYTKTVRAHGRKIAMRVFTGLDPESEKPAAEEISIAFYFERRTGYDMIAQPFNIELKKGWSDGLEKALTRIDSESPACPECGEPMVLRQNGIGNFWGCSTWKEADCQGLILIDQPAPPPVEKEKPVKVKTVPKPEKTPKPKKKVEPEKVNEESFRIPADRISVEQKQGETLFCDTNSDLLFEARPGAGKTTLLRHLATFRGAQDQVAYLAFGRRNAAQGRRTFPKTNVSCLTTHSLGLRSAKTVLGKIPRKPDALKTWTIMDKVYPHCNNDERRRIRHQAARMTKLAKNFAVQPDDPDGLRAVLEQYVFQVRSDAEYSEAVALTEEVLQASLPGGLLENRFDFEDMLWWPVIKGYALQKFDTIFLDEIQDFNRCQIILTERMMAAGARTVAVGDPFQATYRFRGADSDSFQKMGELLASKGKSYRTLRLPTNYRCSKEVVRWTVENTIIDELVASPYAPEGSVRECSYDEALKTAVTDRIGTTAFICRTNAPLIRSAFDVLRRYGCKVRIVGSDLARDLIELVRNVCDYRDDVSILEFQERLGVWMDRQRMRFGHDVRQQAYMSACEDNFESILTLALGCESIEAIFKKINEHFVDDQAIVDPDTFTFVSGHRAKGMEWDQVVWLRPDLCPHPAAETEADRRQEEHLRIIIPTRAKQRLLVAHP